MTNVDLADFLIHLAERGEGTRIRRLASACEDAVELVYALDAYAIDPTEARRQRCARLRGEIRARLGDGCNGGT